MKLIHQFADLEIIPREMVMSSLDSEVYQLLMTISHEGFASLIIGGAVRDLLITGKFPKDFDIELRHPFEYSEGEWSKLLDTLSHRLEKRDGYKIEKLSFSIFRIYLKDSVVEFSSPRQEIYEGAGPWGHSDFRVQLSPKLSYLDSIQRRDFSINTFGIEHGAPGTREEFRFVDSLNAIKDLEASLLKPVGSDFSKDPVRFLRMIRFKQRFNLIYDSKIGEVIHQFATQKLTHFYIISESLKGSPVAFFQELFELKKQFGLAYPPALDGFSFLTPLEVDDKKYENGFAFLSDLLFQHAMDLKIENVSHLIYVFQLKQKLLKDAEVILNFEKSLKGHGDPLKYILPALKTQWVTVLVSHENLDPVRQKYLNALLFLQSQQQLLKQDFIHHQVQISQKLLSYFK